GDLLAFFLITTAVYVVLRLIGMLFKNTITFKFKGGLEVAGGGFVGFLVSACVITIVLLLAGQWPHPKMKQWFAEESWTGRIVQDQLGPTWQRLEKRYPALRLPEGPATEPLSNTLKDVQDDAAQAVEKTEKAVEKKAKKTKKRVSDAVVEGTKK
ncbi:MAG: CvpA family protein, partial [Kiritimatiellaeota bacterium]|nr:CvpA family protein [Kiritimatiellota bacterium]